LTASRLTTVYSSEQDGGKPIRVDVSELSARTERLGPLPLINHVLRRLGLEELLAEAVPTTDKRQRVTHVKALGVLLRSILVERDPIYRQQETLATFAPEAFGVSAAEAEHIGDDAVGRALDRLFDADRGSLLTRVVVAAVKRFEIALDELHDDSTSIKFSGQYRAARGRRIRGKRAPFVTYGHSKDHRPDLKQLLFILTTSRDGGIPVRFRCADGNTSDVSTHEQTWDALCQVTGRTSFLYVADCKLCNEDAMNHIDRRRGRFLAVMPRTRLEDREFRDWIQRHEPPWETVRDAENPRRKDGPRDRWRAFRHHLPSKEGWPVFWLWSSLLALQQEQSRRERLAKAEELLAELQTQLTGSKSRRRSYEELDECVSAILAGQQVARWLEVKIVGTEEHRYRQEHAGRPGPATRYVRRTKRGWRLDWRIDENMIAYDRKSDGMYPLLTNDRTLSIQDAFAAHRRQPAIEKRFEQLKTVFSIAPVFLKNVGRIEAFFCVYFLALLIQALVERELRRGMRCAEVAELPLYPEERRCKHPTAEQIFRLFSLAAHTVLVARGTIVRVVPPELTDLQREVLRLMKIPSAAFSSPR
jgi:transposase